MKKEKAKKIIWIVLLVIFAAIFIFCAVVLIRHYKPNKGFENFVDKNKSSSSSSDTKSKKEELPDNPVDFAGLQAQNPDVCGYIHVDGTNVDYPVMRSNDSEPEDLYLYHDWLKNSKFAGSIYMQKLNAKEFTDPCTVLYGHNMADGSMFAGIRKFRSADFFTANRYITVYVPGHIYKYEIFSAFTYDDRLILSSFDFKEKADYEYFVEESITPKSLRSYNVAADKKPLFENNDKIIILSTCTDSYDELRYLVCGKLVEDTKTK